LLAVSSQLVLLISVRLVSKYDLVNSIHIGGI